MVSFLPAFAIYDALRRISFRHDILNKEIVILDYGPVLFFSIIEVFSLFVLFVVLKARRGKKVYSMPQIKKNK
ncbi:MAG: hypothetical protein ACI92G_000470 [Candidatus Pelagisphaera sp.]|jgi:hypothetical protein